REPGGIARARADIYLFYHTKGTILPVSNAVSRDLTCSHDKNPRAGLWRPPDGQSLQHNHPNETGVGVSTVSIVGGCRDCLIGDRLTKSGTAVIAAGGQFAEGPR